MVAALARALQLDDVERDHLYRAAGLLPPASGLISTHVPPGVQRLIARLGDIPLSVHTVCWDLISWTPQWAALFGDPTEVPPRGRNIVRVAFGVPVVAANRPLVQWRVIHDLGESALRAAFVGDLRAAAVRYPDDPHLAELIRDLRTRSVEFAQLWSTGAVGVHASERKTIRHPVVGDVELDCDVLMVPGADVRIVAYTAAAGTAGAEKLDFLRVAGLVS